jgi:hypothetical protein
MKANQRYQLSIENLPTFPSRKNTKNNGKTQNPVASPTPHNLAKKFGRPCEIQNIYLDFASFLELPP